MKIKFNANEELTLNKTIGIPTMTIVVRVAFHENDKYHLQVFLDDCLYEMQLKSKMN